MKKNMNRIVTLLLLLVLAMSMSLTAFAEDYKGREGWEVVYEGNNKLTPNFTAGDIADELDILQPGDSMTLTITLKNASDKKVNFWMNNSILESFEESAEGAGAAYEYILTYSGREEPLFSSENVGGDDTTAGEGLHEATGALEDMFFLETLDPGKTGVITLYVKLDGETQGNDYQDSMAQIEMQFAVEEVVENETKVVVTGDPTDMLPWILSAAAAGVFLLAVVILRFRAAGRERRR